MTELLSPPDPARPRSFRRYVERAQRRHRQATGSGVAYVLTVFIVFYFTSILAWAWLTLTGPLPEEPLLAEPAGLAVLAAGLLLLEAGWSMLGPITASTAWVSWVLSAPVDRGALLADRARARMALSAAPGAVVGSGIAIASGLRLGPALAMVVLGAIGGVVACAAAIIAQQRPATGKLRWAAVIVLLAAAAAFQFASAPPLPSGAWWPIVAVVAIGAGFLGFVAGRALRTIPPSRLIAADAVHKAVAMSVAEQSLEWIASAHAGANRRARAAYRPLTGTGQSALSAVRRRLFWRDRTGLVRFAAGAAIPWLIVALSHGMPPAPVTVDVISLLAATVAISSTAGTVRRLDRDPRLRAGFGFGPVPHRWSLLGIPAVMAIVWAVLAAPALIIGGPPYMAAAVPALAFAVVGYRLTRREYLPSYLMGAQYHLDTIRYFLRGPAPLFIAACIIVVLARGFTL